MLVVCRAEVRVEFVKVFVFKQKTAYEMRISDWSSDVCSSDLRRSSATARSSAATIFFSWVSATHHTPRSARTLRGSVHSLSSLINASSSAGRSTISRTSWRSEEHTSELQSLMRISYAVFCLKKKKRHTNTTNTQT